MSFDLLVSRARGEYQEMPGLKLTFSQACRLWQLEPATCAAVLDELVDERFLLRTPEGAYIVFTTLRPKVAKASVPPQTRARA